MLTRLGTPVDRVHMDSGDGIEDGPLRGLQGGGTCTRARDKRDCESHCERASLLLRHREGGREREREREENLPTER